MKVSIIIPSYNSFDTIYYCLESVIKQSFGDFECIVVDYPENYKTKKIVSAFQKRDNRIKYVPSPNKGASLQRSLGIELSVGEYISFIDSDDYVDSNYLSFLVSASSNMDITVCKKKKTTSLLEKNNDDVCFNFVTGSKYVDKLSSFRTKIGFVSACAMLIKSTLAKKALTWYRQSRVFDYWEDCIFTYFCFFNCDSYAYTDAFLYNYVQRQESISKKFKEMPYYLNCCFYVSNRLINIIKTSRYPSLYRQASIYAVFGMISYFLEVGINRKQFIAMRNEMKKFLFPRDIVVFEKEYTWSEIGLAFSLKYNMFFISKIIICKLKRNHH